MLKRLPILFLFIAAVLPAQTQLGTFANGIYHHNLTGIEFAVPAEWVIASQGPSSEQSAQVIKLRDAVSNAIGTVWLKSRIAAPADIPALMSERLDVKATQRNNFEGYKYRADSVRNTTIGGRPALSAVADYVSHGQKMVEYLTWVDGEKSRIVFAGRVQASERADFQMRFDPVIQSAIVP